MAPASGNEVDKVLDQLGGYGRYQVWVYVALGLVNLRGALHLFVSMFVGWSPEHHCTPPANHTLNQSLPQEEGDDGEMSWSQCEMYRVPATNSTPRSNDTVECRHGWTYVWDTEGQSSTVSDWNLVCDDKYLADLAVTMYMVGATCATLFLTPLSDRLGRKTVMLGCLWLQAVVGAALALCHSPAPFCVLQFFIGMCNMTIALCAYVLVVETFDTNTRELPALSLQFFWAGGIMLLSLLAYLLPDWRHLELVISLPQLLTISYVWLLPESLTWLLTKGKVAQAKRTILTILRVNRLPPIPDLDNTLSFFSGADQRKTTSEQHVRTPEADEHTADDNQSACSSKSFQPAVSYTLVDLFRFPKIRRYSLCMFYLYLVNSLAYFAIGFYTPLLNGNTYLNTFISGVVEVPAYIVSIICNRRIGRRWPILVFLLICAAATIAVSFTPDQTASGTDLSDVKTALVMIGKFGISGSYAALYLYGTEIFPTAIRNHAVGLCSFFENMGSIAAPQIVFAAKWRPELPMNIIGVMTVAGALTILLLPETHNRPLPQTIQEAEKEKERGVGRSGENNRETPRHQYYVNEGFDSVQPD